ncbi:MAG: hypothetical protein ACJ8IK_06245 [Burkholderiaceae bacterium]|jgi:hypothetical protein
MKNSLRPFLALLLLAFAATGHAASIAVLPVTIDPDSKMPDAVRQECRLDYELQNNILTALQRYDSDAALTTDASKGQALKVTISYVLGVGGGAWTGPKVLAVKAEFLKDGKVAFATKMHRRSSLGAMFRGTCTLLDGASKGLGAKIAKWAQHPVSKLRDDDDDVVAGERPSVVNGIDPNAEAPVADTAASAAR